MGDGDIGDLVASVTVEGALHADDVGDLWLGTVIAPVEGHGVTGVVGASLGQSTVNVSVDRGDGGEGECEDSGQDSEPRGGGMSHRAKVVPHRGKKSK